MVPADHSKIGIPKFHTHGRWIIIETLSGTKNYHTDGLPNFHCSWIHRRACTGLSPHSIQPDSQDSGDEVCWAGVPAQIMRKFLGKKFIQKLRISVESTVSMGWTRTKRYREEGQSFVHQKNDSRRTTFLPMREMIKSLDDIASKMAVGKWNHYWKHRRPYSSSGFGGQNNEESQLSIPTIVSYLRFCSWQRTW